MANAQNKHQRADLSLVGGGERRLRADARRSTEALVAAAKELFATTGVDVTTREIAGKAGVGMGTLFRRFPQRADLVTAVFHPEMDACAEAAATLVQACAPFEALARWMQVYVRFVSTKRGLAKALGAGDPVFVGLFERFDQRLRPVARELYGAAVAAGQAQPGQDAAEILCAVTALCMSSYDGKPDHAAQMVALLVQGLRLPY